MAANVNYDSGNIWGLTRDITYIGLGKSSLDDVAMTVAAHQNRTLKGDQFPDRGRTTARINSISRRSACPRSISAPARISSDRPAGWGAQQIDAYTERDYHQPSDELTPNWNFDGMVQDAQFGFLAGLIVANAEELPAWNPGNEFEAARAAAIAAAP